MIVVDTSALIAILLDEPSAQACRHVLEAESDVRLSAGTLSEALIVAVRRNLLDEMAGLVDAVAIAVESVTAAQAQRVADAYARWGKGIHPAGLNFGDCFAYALAKDLDCPLLFVGTDFVRTDIRSALA